MSKVWNGLTSPVKMSTYAPAYGTDAEFVLWRVVVYGDVIWPSWAYWIVPGTIDRREQ